MTDQSPVASVPATETEPQRSSAWEQIKRPPRPKSPKEFDWRAKAESWGLDLDQPYEPEPVTGPVADVSPGHHTVIACSGTFRITEQDGPIWTATCDQCRAQVGAPARRMDPGVRREALLREAGLPEMFASKKLDRTLENGPVLDALSQWADSFDPKLGAASLLPAPWLWSEPGRGKSHILTKVCQRAVQDCDLAVAFTSTRALLRDLQRFDNDVVRGRAWERATTIDLLALDDVGAEQTTDWRLDQLAELIDERYQAERPIVMATNYPPSAWEQVLDARSVSRLRQMTFSLELKGPDRRIA